MFNGCIRFVEEINTITLLLPYRVHISKYKVRHPYITHPLNNYGFVLIHCSALYSNYGLADSTVGQFRQKNSNYDGQSLRINCGETTKQSILNNNGLNTDHSMAIKMRWWGTQYGPMDSQWWVHCCRRPRHWPWRGIANSHCCHFDCHWLRPIKLWYCMTEGVDELVSFCTWGYWTWKSTHRCSIQLFLKYSLRRFNDVCEDNK